jgi:hypothetical protein
VKLTLGSLLAHALVGDEARVGKFALANFALDAR